MTQVGLVGSAPLRTYSLFSGIAGIEVGLAQSGAADVAGYCERWAPAQAVLRARFPDTKVDDDIAELGDLRQAELVTAGFPCTDLSQAGRTRGLDGSQSGLVLRLLQLVDVHRPKWLLLENVPNMLHLSKGRAMARIVEELESAGYSWAYRVLDSRFTGLAQRRRRVIILASSEQDPAPLLFSEDAGTPDAQIEASAYGFSWTEGNNGLGWAVGAVPTLKGGSTVRVASPPAVWLPASAPGRQIVRPTIETMELLQGFAPGWTAAAPERDRWKLVGNAVSTRVAAWVGEQLAKRTSMVDGVWREEVLEDGARWPSAARGFDGKRWSAMVSEYPKRPRTAHRQDLHTILLKLGSEPLSYRATKGFRDRLVRSNLRYRPDFLQALDRHIVSQAP